MWNDVGGSRWRPVRRQLIFEARSPEVGGVEFPTLKLVRGIHVMHVLYRIQRAVWDRLPPEQSTAVLGKLKKLLALCSQPCQPNIRSYLNLGGKADLVFWLRHADAFGLSQLHRDLENCFPAGVLAPVFSFLSVTELTEYQATEEDRKNQVAQVDKLAPATPEFDQRLAEVTARQQSYEHLRLYPELEDWEVMAFYPMNKRRIGADNWYLLDHAARKRLMAGHARVGRRYAGRISQLITGSTGLDDWEWGVTLLARQLDDLKEIVYEMRFDEVSARYGEFGPFFVNLRLSPAQIWHHLRL